MYSIHTHPGPCSFKPWIRIKHRRRNSQDCQSTRAFYAFSHTIVASVCLEQPKPGKGWYLANDLPKVTFADPVVWEVLVRAPKAVVYGSLLTCSQSLHSYVKPVGYENAYGTCTDNQRWRSTLPRVYSQEPTKETRQMEHMDQGKEPPTLLPLTPLTTTIRRSFHTISPSTSFRTRRLMSRLTGHWTDHDRAYSLA